MLGVELVDLDMNFDICGSIRAPVTGLIASIGIGVELVQDVLDITLVLDNQKASLEVLSEGQLLVDISLAWYLSASYAA